MQFVSTQILGWLSRVEQCEMASASTLVSVNDASVGVVVDGIVLLGDRWY